MSVKLGFNILKNFIGFGLIFINYVYADFVPQTTFCTLSNNFEGKTSNDVDFDGVINLSFVGKEVSLPLINVSLSRNIKPVSMSLSWPNVDLVDQQNRPIFKPEYQKRLEEERHRKYELYNENDVYYSKPYGFYRLQNFITLFLSQNTVTLEFKEENSSEVQKIVVPLAGSDQGFRTIAYECYPNLVKDYINSDLSRKVPVYESWLNGYGLSTYFKYEDLLPEVVRYPNEISPYVKGDAIGSYKKFESLYGLLVQKSNLLMEVQTIESSDDYLKFRDQVNIQADKIAILSAQRDELNGPNGILKQLDNDIQDLNLKIESTKNLISLFQNQLNPKNQSKLILQEQINSLNEKLAIYENKIKNQQGLIAQGQSNLSQLKEILNKYAEKVKNKISEQEKAEILSTPYSIEAVLESKLNLDQQIKEQAELETNVQLLNKLSIYVDELMKKYIATNDLFNTISDLKLNKVKKQKEQLHLELQRNEFLDLMDHLDFKSLDGYITKDKSESGVKVTVGDLKSQIINLIKAKYLDLDQNIQQNNNSKAILMKVVCSSEVFLKTYQGQCLNLLYIDDIKKMELYLDELDSTVIFELNKITSGEQSLVHRYEKSKLTSIAEYMINESKSDIAQSLKNKWVDILYLRWKYYAIKNMDDATWFEVASLRSLLKEQKKQYELIVGQSAKLNREIVEIDKKLNKLQFDYNKIEGVYFENLDKTQKILVQEIELAKVNLANANLSCLLNLSDVESCSKSLDLFNKESTSKLKENQMTINKQIKLLVVAADILLNSVNIKIKSDLTQLDILIEEKKSFLNNSEYETKSKNLSESANTINQLNIRLKMLFEQSANLQSQKKKLEENNLFNKLQVESIISEITVLADEMKPAMTNLKPVCAKLDDLTDKIFVVETQIYQAFLLEQTPQKRFSICQINY